MGLRNGGEGLVVESAERRVGTKVCGGKGERERERVLGLTEPLSVSTSFNGSQRFALPTNGSSVGT